MAPQKKRENRENQFYNVGVQGRKTGITLPDRGVYDENGLEALSGIFSSPEKSPPKRVAMNTGSESMDLQESSIPELTTAHQIFGNNRTRLPPPRSRSPKKTALGSSPRRQSSMAPRGASLNVSSPIRAASTSAVARRLDFEQDESSLQETPALSGSGQRRGKRADVYDLPEDSSPVPVIDESLMQAEITANESSINNGPAQESFIAQIGDDTVTGAEDEDVEMEIEESEVLAPPPTKQPAKTRGRKRKSDIVEDAAEHVPSATKTRKRGAPTTQVDDVSHKSRKIAPAQSVPGATRRSKRVSDMTEQEPSILEEIADVSVEPAEPAIPKKRGRPARPKVDANKENAPTAKTTKVTSSREKEQEPPVFKKPQKPVPKPAGRQTAKNTPGTATSHNESISRLGDLDKLVDATGRPRSQKDIEQMSAASASSRYGRGRNLSVFREMDPDIVAPPVGRTGRHRVAPINFWANERTIYDPAGNMTAIVKNEDKEEPRKSYKNGSKARGRKKLLTAIEEEEIELEPWEEDGELEGNYKEFDPETEMGSSEIATATIAWSDKGMNPQQVPDGSFQYQKLGQGERFFNWGLIELQADQMKRTKNSRRMHMAFNVQIGTVEVRVHDNEFIVHKAGVWQVPRGNTYSIRNVGTGTARIFFAQASESRE